MRKKREKKAKKEHFLYVLDAEHFLKVFPVPAGFIKQLSVEVQARD